MGFISFALCSAGAVRVRFARALETGMTTIETHDEIREAVGRLCEDFPGSYWRGLDETRAYPTEFVTALT